MLFFKIPDAPYCKPDQVQVFGVAREESVRVSCEVEANPVGSTTFEWRFNASGDGEVVDVPHDRFVRRSPALSVVEYVPRTELDYGSLLCRATNSVGRQREPCVFHLVPAGAPDPVRNCSFGNQTTTSLQVRKSIKLQACKVARKRKGENRKSIEFLSLFPIKARLLSQLSISRCYR